MPASFLANATAAIFLPRRRAIFMAHARNSAVAAPLFRQMIPQATSTNKLLIRLFPALLIRPRACFSPELNSRGTSPK